MNGRFTTAVNFGNPGLSDFINTNLANRTNSSDLSFPWSGNIQTNRQQGFSLFSGKYEPSGNDIANDNTRSTFDPWGLKGNPIIDDNLMQISTVDHSEDLVDPQNSIIPESTQLEIEGGTEVAEEAADVLKGAEIPEAIAEGAEASTPWGLAAIVAQQAGSAVSSSIVSGLQNQQTADFSQNIQQHGLSTVLNADIIRSQQENTIRNQEVGGQIGSFFGPIGALIGHAVAGYASANSQQLATAGSFQGWVNPQQSNIVASAQTSNDNGVNTQIDNVDTAANS